MILALIFSVLAAIVFFSLFLDERSTLSDRNREIKDLEKTISNLSARPAETHPARVEQRGLVDDQNNWDMTPQLVGDVVRYNGYIPETLERGVIFRIQGETYLIRTDRLPYIWLEKSYSIDPGDYDMPLLKEAAREITEGIFIGKTLITDDNTSLRFQADAFEPKYGHFRDALGCYLDVIHNMQNRLREVYEEKRKQKENQQQLESMGFRQKEEAPGEHKILS